jgi:hypothetical protein
MSVVTIAEAWPAAGRPFTFAELDRMPDDGRRYELLDGALAVSPRPTTVHPGRGRAAIRSAEQCVPRRPVRCARARRHAQTADRVRSRSRG